VSAPGLAAERRAARLRQPARLPFLRGLSIRWRLTLWYTAVLSLTLMVFSLVVYWFAVNGMVQDVDHASVERANQVDAILGRVVQIRRSMSPTQAQWLSELGVIDTTLDPFQYPGVGVRVRLYVQGTTLQFASERLKDTGYIPDDRMHLLRAEQGTTTRGLQPTADGNVFYVYTRPYYDVDQRRLAAVVQIFTSMKPNYDRLDWLKRVLVIGTILGTLLALVVGAAVAQVALAPINAITRTAGQINRTQDLGRRIPDTGHRDEIGRLAVTFNEMLDRIEAMFDRQRQLVADVSHELRTPLTTIRGEVDLMTRRGELDPEGLAAVREESARMGRMINDLLLLAQADSGLAVEQFPVALDDLLTGVLRQARTLTADPAQLRLGRVQPATVMGDADRLRQLVLNLVDNALKHNPPGTTVTLELTTAGDEAVLVVADDGRGIPPEDLARIFDRFYRVDKARTRQAGGTGLGLSIVQWIAAAHGGQVEVASRPGEGTRFTVRLPLAAGADEAEAFGAT